MQTVFGQNSSDLRPLSPFTVLKAPFFQPEREKSLKRNSGESGSFPPLFPALLIAVGRLTPEEYKKAQYPQNGHCANFIFAYSLGVCRECLL